MNRENCDIQDFLFECMDEIDCVEGAGEAVPCPSEGLPLCSLCEKSHACCVYMLLRFTANLGDHAEGFLQDVVRRYRV